MLHAPTFDMVSFGGFFPSICSLFVFLGLVQYLSSMPSLNHFFFDRSKEAKRTALLVVSDLEFGQKQGHALCN